MTNANIPEHAVFRFRSIDALLGEFDELEKQSIYFSAPAQLNDPMEGIRRFHWKGDKITWINLLRHYVICLCNRCSLCAIAGESMDVSEDGVTVFQTLDNSPTPQARQLFEDCLDAVTSSPNYALVLDILSAGNRAIGRPELLSTLNTVHIEWVTAILSVFHKSGLVPNAPPPLLHAEDITTCLKTHRDIMPEVLEELPEPGLEIMGEIQALTHEQMNLLNLYNNHDNHRPNQMSLLMRFPNQYLNDILKLIHPEWYVSCFSKTYKNTAMWSYYASNHNGCCLIFTPSIKDGKPHLPIKGMAGYAAAGPSVRYGNYLLEDVAYTADIPSLNFFETIGRLSHKDIMDNWFRSGSGETSPLPSFLDKENFDQWRSHYWETFHAALLRKLEDWKHEQESRIILTDTLDRLHEPAKRLFEYDFNALEGVIFGIRVNMMDKVRIMQILDSKLSTNPRSHPFKYFQAQVKPHSGRIEAVHLSLLERSQNQ